MTNNAELPPPNQHDTQPEAHHSGFWGNLASGIWECERLLASDIVHGRASIGEYGFALAEAGAAVAIGAAALPEISIGLVAAGLGAAAVGTAAFTYDMAKTMMILPDPYEHITRVGKTSP